MSAVGTLTWERERIRDRLATNFGRAGAGSADASQSLGSEWAIRWSSWSRNSARTFRENGNRGTDHGHGTVYWVLGGSGQRRHDCRRAAARESQHLVSRSGLPVLNDYRAVLGGLFRPLWACPRIKVPGFPEMPPVDLKLV